SCDRHASTCVRGSRACASDGVRLADKSVSCHWKGRRDRHFPRPGGQYRRTSPGEVVHSPRGVEKPWKRQGGGGFDTGFPHLWRAVWSSDFPLQISVFCPNGACAEGPLAPRFLGGILGASVLRAEDEQDPMEHPIEPTADSLWDDVATRLRGALNEKTFGNWFSEVDPVAVDDDAFVLAVPNDFTREWIEGHFVEVIRAA